MLVNSLARYSKSLFIIYDNATSDNPIVKWDDFISSNNTYLKYDDVAKSLLLNLINQLIQEIKEADQHIDSLSLDLIKPNVTKVYYKYLVLHSDELGQVYEDEMFKGLAASYESSFNKALKAEMGARVPSLSRSGEVIHSSKGVKSQLVTAVSDVFKAFLKGMVKAIYPRAKADSRYLIRGHRMYDYLKVLNIICEMKGLVLFDIPDPYM